MIKFITATLCILFAGQAFAQGMNPADIAERFMICNGQDQTQQVMIFLDETNAPKGGTYMKTDAPGSTNVQEMVQLNVLSVGYDETQVSFAAEGITDASKTFEISAQAMGEHNITPTLKTMVYMGSLMMEAGSKSTQAMCVVLSSDEMSEISPQ